MMADRELLLNVLNELSADEYCIVRFHLSDKRLNPPLSRYETDNIHRTDLVVKLEQTYADEAIRITADIMKKIKRKDLCDMLKEEASDGVLALGRGDKVMDLAVPSDSQQTAYAEETVRENGVREMTTSNHQQKVLSQKLVTDKQLILLAKKFDRSWKQIAIEFLEMESYKLEQIEENHPNNFVMRAFHMLKAWKNKEKKKATPAHLYQILSQDGVPLEPEAYEFLEEPAT